MAPLRIRSRRPSAPRLLPLLALLLALLVAAAGAADPAAGDKDGNGGGSGLISIRLSEGVDRQDSPPAGEGQTAPPAKRPPNLPYGPAIVAGLAGKQIVGTAGGYEYTLTLFHNLTQRKVSDGPTALGNRLGVWERWEVEEEEKGRSGGFLMRFSDGDDCAAAANMSRAAVVKFECVADAAQEQQQQQQQQKPDPSKSDGGRSFESSYYSPPAPAPGATGDFALAEIKEPSTCSYTLTLKTPIPCRLLTRDAHEFRKPLAAVQPPGYALAARRAAGGSLPARLRRLVRAVAAAFVRLLRAAWWRLREKAKGALTRGRPVAALTMSNGCKCDGGGGQEEKGLISEVKGLREELREIKTLVLQGQGQQQQQQPVQ